MAGKTKAGGLPFLGVAEGIDLVKKVWGVTGLPMLPTPATMAQFAQRLPQTLPSMIAPTLDVEELDKRIADLRAVEQWLNLNLSMLRTTVQSLEVQRNTIATLKSFGGAMLAGAAPAAAAAPNWPYPAAGPSMAAPVGTPVAAPAPLPTSPPPAAGKKRRKKDTGDGETPSLPLNPTAWWNTLQDQFVKIAATAAAEAQAAAKAAAAADEAAPKAGAGRSAPRAAPPPAKAKPRARQRR
jgi:hypothetical protein